MALANQRDGGHVIVGISESSNVPNGLSQDEVLEFTDYDTVSDRLNGYADPPLRINVAVRNPSAEIAVAVVEVSEFDDVPVLCKRDFPGVLVAGQLYTRSMAKPESSAQHTQNEIRAVLALATDKSLGRFIEMSRRVGVDLEAATPALTDQQYAAAAESEMFVDILGSPHFAVRIEPVSSDAEAIPYTELWPTVTSSQINAHGWSFPLTREQVRGNDWFGSRTEMSRGNEAWRLYESGLFVSAVAFPTHFGADWDSMYDPPAGDSHLPVWFLAAYVTMSFEFAARLQRARFPEAAMRVTLRLGNATDWALVVANSNRAGFFGRYVLQDGEWSRTVDLTPADVITNTRADAAEVLRDLLLRFGWDGVTVEILRGLQDETLGAESS